MRSLWDRVPANVMEAINHGLPTGGFTVNLRGRTPITGYQVGGVATPVRVDPPFDSPQLESAVTNHYREYPDLYDEPSKRMYIGGWVGPDGKLWVEPSQNVSERETAMNLGVARNQVSIWDVEASEEIPTGGTGA